MQHKITVNNNEITLYSVKYKQCINNEEDLSVGTVACAELTFVTDYANIFISQPSSFKYYVDNNLIGTFYPNSVEKIDDSDKCKVVSYDFSTIKTITLNSDATEWWNETIYPQLPLTARQVFNKVGQAIIETVNGATFANENFSIKPVKLYNVTYRQILSYLAQIAGGYCYKTSDGKMTIKSWIKSYTDLYFISDIKIKKAKVDSGISNISCVNIATGNDDNGISYPATGGDNPLRIISNPFLYADTDAEILEVQTVAENIYNAIVYLSMYNPGTIELFVDNPIYECGKEMRRLGSSDSFPIMTREWSDKDYKISATGNERRNQTIRPAELAAQANNKYVKIKTEVDGISTIVGEHSTEIGTLESQITQQAGLIDAKVSKENTGTTFGWNLQDTGMNIYNEEGNLVEINSSGLSVKGNIQAKTGSIGTGLFKSFGLGTSVNLHIDMTAIDSSYDFTLIGSANQLVGKDSGTVFYSGRNANYTAQFTVTASTIESESTILFEILYQGQPFDEYTRMKSTCGTFYVTQTERTGFTIESGKLYNGKSTITDNNDGVYLGINGIALGKSAFSVDNQGNIKANAGDIGPLQINRWNGSTESESISFQSEQVTVPYSYNLYFDTPKSAADSEKQAVIRINHGTDPENPYYVDISKVLMAFRNFNRSQGTYTLKMAVDSNGKVTYSWVKES